MNIIKPSTSMRLGPKDDQPLETECLFGENIEIIDEKSDWYFCKLLTDNYIGWVKKDSVGFLPKPTHRILSSRAFIYEDYNIKSNCVYYLPMGSKIQVKYIKDDWAKIYLSDEVEKKFGYVMISNLIKISDKVSDWVSSAEQLIETPYRWGGRDTIGIDCSALLQLAYQTYGENIPRNTINQSKIKKKEINDKKDLIRGCVIFWDGHVGIMTDKFNCIHGNAFHMKTIVEPLDLINSRMKDKSRIIKMTNFN